MNSRFAKDPSKALLLKMLLIHLCGFAVCLAFLHLSRLLSSWFPQRRCVLVETLGLYCPGCGGTRALSHLFHLQLGKAFFSYPPLFVAIGVLLWYDVLGILAVITKNMAYLEKIKLRHWIFVAAVIGVFFVLRNVALFYGYDYLGDILVK